MDGAGLKQFDARPIVVEPTFATFEDYWATGIITGGVRPQLEALALHERQGLQRVRALSWILSSTAASGRRSAHCAWHYAAWRCPRAPLNSLIVSRLNAGRSSGLRLVTKPLSTTASSSTQSAPAFLRSGLSEGHEVMRRPRAAPVSITVQGPWQIAATGLELR